MIKSKWNVMFVVFLIYVISIPLFIISIYGQMMAAHIVDNSVLFAVIGMVCIPFVMGCMVGYEYPHEEDLLAPESWRKKK